MAGKPKNKMPASLRAKQFAPFAALKGFEDALREQEKICVEKKEVSEEKAREINEALKTVSPGDRISLTYYKNKQYLSLVGVAEKFDLSMKYLEISGEHVTFDDIFEIEKLL